MFINFVCIKPNPRAAEFAKKQDQSNATIRASYKTKDGQSGQ